MAKSADAFRTISEVADWLETPAHVLRFWESKFAQVKPVKRAGGRRYYRPQDMRLLGGIKRLLHDEGMTIKGVQKLLRDKGVRHVAALSAPLIGEDEEDARAWAMEAAGSAPPPPARPEPAQVLDFRRQTADPAPAAAAPAPAADEPAAPDTADPAAGEPAAASPGTARAVAEAESAAAPGTTEEPATGPAPAGPGADRTAAEKARLPAFLNRPSEAAAEPPATPQETEPAAAPSPRPATVDVPPDPDDTEFARPGPLSRITALPRPLPAPVAEAIRPLLARLDAVRRKSGTDQP